FADIASNFEGNGAKFQNKEMTADFGSMKVRGYAFFNGAVFEGPANFGSADIASNLHAQGVKFQNKEKIADFSSMKVGGDTSFNDAVFEGPVSFILADIAGNFSGRGARFQNKETGSQLQQFKSPRLRLFLERCGIRRTGGLRLGKHRQHFRCARGKVSEQGKASQLRGQEGRGVALFGAGGV